MMKKIIIYIFFLVCWLCFFDSVSQVIQSGSNISSGSSFNQPEIEPWDLWMNPTTNDFDSIVQQVEAYYAGKDKGRGSGYKQYSRWKWFNQYRLTNDRKLVNIAAQNLKEHIKFDQQNANKTNHGYWTQKTTNTYSTSTGWNGGIGRVNCVGFHPTNQNIMYIGTPAGGLWKTTNALASSATISWTPLTDGMPVLGVSGIAVSHANTNHIYILTGDGDGAHTFSIGVLKSIDGGNTWATTGLTWTIGQQRLGYKLIMHPSNANILFAVTSLGIYKTSNGGTSWTQVRAGWFYDIEFKPGSPATMYATQNDNFWRSTNTGDTWTEITGILPTCERTAIAVTSDNANYVYLFAADYALQGGSAGFDGLFRSFDSGLSFDPKANTPNIMGYPQNGSDTKEQSPYDVAFVANRDDVADIMMGAINIWKSTSYGNAGTLTLSAWWDSRGMPGTEYAHADIHALEYNPLNGYVYCGSDGGIYRSSDFGTNWTDISRTLDITQWYRIANYESNYNFVVGGTQDNGSNEWNGGTFDHVRGADGMDAMISRSTTNTYYTTRQYGILEKTTDNGATWTTLLNPGGPWVTPLVMHPTTSNTFYVGLSGVRKTTNGGSSFTTLAADGRGALAMGVNNTNRIYAANGSTLRMSNDAGATWTIISGGLPAGRNITFIAVDPDNSPNVFVTLDGFDATNKVYASFNAGTSWTNYTGSLPNVAMNCIASPDDNLTSGHKLYVGTDIGMFYRDDAIGDWVSFRNGLPSAPVFDIEIYEASNKVIAATFGRGLWQTNAYSNCPWGWNLTQANDPSNPNSSGVQRWEASDNINSSRIITGGLGTDVIYQAANTVTLTTGFHAEKDNAFHAKLGPCNTVSVAQPPPQIPLIGKFVGSYNESAPLTPE